MIFKLAPCKEHQKHDLNGLICIKIRRTNTGEEASPEEIMAEMERLEAELAESDRVLAIHKRDYEAHFKAHQEDLAKREKALEESLVVAVALAAAALGKEPPSLETGKDASAQAILEFSEELPIENYAEWLKQRGKS